jgi:hypothetical protein
MKGADTAAVMGTVVSGGNNLGAEDDFGIVGERQPKCITIRHFTIPFWSRSRF